MAKYIYLISVLEEIDKLPLIFLMILGFGFLILIFILIFEYENGKAIGSLFLENIKKYKKIIKRFFVVYAISILLSIAIPTREEMYMIFLSNYITIDNYNIVKSELKEGIDYLTDKLGK